MAAGQVWRLLTASFLHANLLHVAFNVFFQLRMGFRLERRYGVLKFALLYALSAIYGNLLSAAVVFCNAIKVGASTAGEGNFTAREPKLPPARPAPLNGSRWGTQLRVSGFGMMGVEVAELALSWRRMQHRDRLLLNLVSFFLLMGLFAFTLNGGAIDQLGHLGGFLCGTCFAVAKALASFGTCFSVMMRTFHSWSVCL